MAKKGKNVGLAKITGNFIKKKSNINWKIIGLEILLSIITAIWIYKVRIMKRI